MTGRVNAYNASQKISSITFAGTVITYGSTPAVIYTCPAGKRASILNFSDTNIALGANTTMWPRVKGQKLRSSGAIETVLTIENASISMTLVPGDTVDFLGNNAGNNGTANYILTVQELPF